MQSFVVLCCVALGVFRKPIPTRTTRVALWDPPSGSKKQGETGSDLYDVDHGVLEEDEVHRRAADRLVVLAHEHLESRVQCLVVWQLSTTISSRIIASSVTIHDKMELSRTKAHQKPA